MNHKTIKVGVIGSGGMGSRHARNLSLRTAGAEVVAVMDIDQTRAQTIASECGATRVYADGHELIASAEVDAVVIASPDTTHAELVLSCLAAGKPVLCEKPLASTPAEAEQIMQAEVKVGKRLLQLGLMREFDPVHRDAKDALDRGDIGQPILFRGIHINPAFRGVRMLEDVIVNSAVHDIHSTRWIMQSEVDCTFAQYVVAAAGQPESCRMVSIQLKLNNGTLAVLEVNTDSGYGYEVDIEITGTTGSIKTDSIQSPIVRSSSTRGQFIDSDWLGRFDTAYIIETQAWIDSIINDKPIGPSVWDGYMAQIIADACVTSARTDQPVNIQASDKPSIYT